jgi:hypothetical protein
MQMTIRRTRTLAFALALVMAGVAGCSREAPPPATATAPAETTDAVAPVAPAAPEKLPPAAAAHADAYLHADAPPDIIPERDPDDPRMPPAAAAHANAPASIAVGEPNPSAPGAVDTSCRTDADCAIKDVGSCCGARPACVNVSSPTFPEQVKAQCKPSGRMGICGYPAITGCKCTNGMCQGTGADATVQ